MLYTQILKESWVSCLFTINQSEGVDIYEQFSQAIGKRLKRNVFSPLPEFCAHASHGGNCLRKRQSCTFVVLPPSVHIVYVCVFIFLWKAREVGRNKKKKKREKL